MRLVVLLVAATATGAVSAKAIQTVFPQAAAQTVQVMRTLGDDLKDFKISEFNPVKAYLDTMAKIAGGDSNWMSSPVSASGPAYNTRPIDFGALRPHINFDAGQIKRSIDAGFASRVQQDVRRMQDISAFARNPAGWRGLPPH